MHLCSEPLLFFHLSEDPKFQRYLSREEEPPEGAESHPPAPHPLSSSWDFSMVHYMQAKTCDYANIPKRDK